MLPAPEPLVVVVARNEPYWRAKGIAERLLDIVGYYNSKPDPDNS